MIKLTDVSVASNEKVILDSVSLEVEKGETFVILGPSGAGKSSILKIICGLWKPQFGSVEVDGHDILELKNKNVQTIRQKIGMVFQSNALFDSLIVAENVGYFLTESGNRTLPEIDEIIEQSLAFVNMEGTGHLAVDQLSGGMKKRVAIARALAFDPDILLFDEPTTGLDPINARAILELINKIRIRGKTSVVVTHILSDAFVISDRFAVIKDGQVIENGNKYALLTSQNPFVREFVGEYQLDPRALTF